MQATTRIQYETFAERLRARGIFEDSTSRVICRWRQSDPPLILDVMPVDGRVFGFGNRWYEHAMAHPVETELPSGRSIRHCSAVTLVATKLEAYADRGASDPLVSHDLEDVVRLFDSRPSLVEEIDGAGAEIRTYVADAIGSILDAPIARASVPQLMLPDAASQRRAHELVLPRMEQVRVFRF